MKFPTVPIEYVEWPSSDDLRSDEMSEDESWSEDIATVSSGHGFGFPPNQYGSFDWLPSSTASNSSNDVKGPFNDALNEAQVARLNDEEVEAYLKSVLNMTPIRKTSNAPTAGDAHADNNFNNPWIPVTHRHSAMHTMIKPGHPTAVGGRADQNWTNNAGLYSTRLWKSFRPASAPAPLKKHKNKKNYDTTPTNVQHRERGMPAYLVKELDELDTTEFEIALNYWMNDANFIGYPTTMVLYEQPMTAYDESIYPNEQFKPTGRYGRRHRRVNVPIQRNQALSFACRAFIEYHQHQRLPTKVAQTAYMNAINKKQNLDQNQYNCLHHYNECKFFPHLFAQSYWNAKHLHPFGYEVFVMNINRNCKEYDLLKNITGQREKLIQKWHMSSKISTSHQAATGTTPWNHLPKWHHHNRRRHHRRYSNNIVTRFHSMKPRKTSIICHRHHCFATRQPVTPSFLQRWNITSGPTPTIEDNDEQQEEEEDNVSIVLSNASQQVDQPRLDLHAATLGHVTPAAAEHHHLPTSNTRDTTQENTPSLPGKKKKRGKSNKKKKKRKSKYSSRSRHSILRSPDGGEDGDSSSDCSSSSSDGDSTTTFSSCEDSILAFGKRGTIANIRALAEGKDRFKMSKRIGKQVKRLTAAAKTYELREFVINRGTIEQRKAHFLYWANTLREMLTPMYRYQALMRDFPRLDNSELTITANTALGLFLRLKLKQATLQTIEASIKRENHDNGYLILRYLFAHYGNTSDVDISNAKQRLDTTLWNDRDTIDTYTQRFMKRLTVVQESIASRPDLQHMAPSDDQITMLYLRLLVTSLPKTHELRHIIQVKYAKCQSDIAAFNTLDCNVSGIQYELFQLQLTEDAHLDAPSNYPSQRTRRPYHQYETSTKRKPYNPSQYNPPKARANTALHSNKFRDIKCWGCGRNHHLRDCPTTSSETRHRLWEEHRNRNNKNTINSPNFKTNRTDSQNTNRTSSLDTPHPLTAAHATATSPHNSQPPSNPSSNTPNARRITMRNKKAKDTALATRHKAFVGVAYNINNFHHPQQQVAIIPNVTSINDWLIDSGATAHMTHTQDDFNGPLTPFESLVETANGGIIHVTHRGNVDIYLEDAFNPNNSIIVEVRNVLFVPGLTRRLISVSEWNACGGQILHLKDRTTVQVYNDDDEMDATIDLPPCPGSNDQTAQILNVRTHHQKKRQTRPRVKISQSLLHRRLGHRSMSSILMAKEDQLWEDVRIVEDRDEFCETCSITTARKANTGTGTLEAINNVVPGEVVMIDIVTNPATQSITQDTHFKHYLLVLDMASRFFVPIGMNDKKPRTVFEALKMWSRQYGPSESFNFSQLEHIHGDYDAVYRSNEFKQLAAQANIRLSFAAPRHQEQNGICESNWKHVRDLAFAFMNHAQVDMTFFHCALQHAFKIHSVLPHRALTKADGTVQCPAGVYFGRSISISDFRVLFCPVVMTYDSVFVSNPRHNDSIRKQPRLQQLNRKNNPQRGMRGIHVGVPNDAKGYLVYVPKMGRIYTSTDVYFDEDFNSTIAVRPNKFSGYIDLTITEATPDMDLPWNHTGDSFAFAKRNDDNTTVIAKPFDSEQHDQSETFHDAEDQAMEEESIDSLFASDNENETTLHNTFQGRGNDDNNNINNNDNDAMNKSDHQHNETDNDDGGAVIDDGGAQEDVEMFSENVPIENNMPTDLEEADDDSVTTVGDIDEYEFEPAVPDDNIDGPTDDVPPPLLVQSVRRSQRQKFPTVRYTHCANSATYRNFSEIPEQLHQYIEHTHLVEVTNSVETPTIDPLIPTPENWKQILHYPPHIKTLWIRSFVKELKELIKKGTVIHEMPNIDDPIIPVTAKYRVKLTSDGQVDKLKTRIALRGDLMKETMFTPDTWCPIAGFRALRLFLSFAVEYRQRVYQLDYVAAFLQSDVIGRKFTTFPEGWKELLSDYPDLHKWLGVPLRLMKSLYGDRVANLAWDETQSRWLTSNEIGFQRLPSEGSIYIKRTNQDFIAVLNAVDDQLYFATDPSLKTWFEEATKQRFDVQLMGQAIWYLQSRITQCTDFSIILDQSRYAALVIQKYLNGTSETAITPEMKTKYATPTPTTATFTKRDCSQTYVDVIVLQGQFGFEYAAVVGSLIYLMNTYIRLNYAIRKLARFMQLPGKNHFKLLLHLLRHLQCYRLLGGLKFYSDITKSPLYRHLTVTGHNNLTDFPIIVFSDSSFQDCPDSARSTGGFLIFMQGTVVDVTSTMPQLISWSTCEAEYCMASLAAMAAFFIRKVYNELHGNDSDHQLTIPLGIDSQSAMDTAISHKETQRTRHFARRFHFIRLAVASSHVLLFKIDGTANCSNSLTKPLPADQLAKETELYEVEVKP